MLVDRRELLEHDIKKLHAEAAAMYLDIVIKGDTEHDAEYQELKNKIASLKFDLNMVNQLILQGKK